MANRVILLGRLGADPEIKRFNDGGAIANLRVATSERWKDKGTGERKERTDWHSVVLNGGLVSVAEQYLQKGDQVYIEGKLQTRKWQDKNGNDRYITEVIVKGFGGVLEMIGGGNGRSGNDGSDGRSGGRSGGGSGGGRNDSGSYSSDLDDEIPF